MLIQQTNTDKLHLSKYVRIQSIFQFTIVKKKKNHVTAANPQTAYQNAHNQQRIEKRNNVDLDTPRAAFYEKVEEKVKTKSSIRKVIHREVCYGLLLGKVGEDSFKCAKKNYTKEMSNEQFKNIPNIILQC